METIAMRLSEARAQASRGEVLRSEELIEAVLAEEPENFWARLYRGHLLLAQGLLDPAQEERRRAERAAKDPRELVLAGDLGRKIEALGRRRIDRPAFADRAGRLPVPAWTLGVAACLAAVAAFGIFR